MKAFKTITSALAVATLLLATTTMAGPIQDKKVTMGAGIGIPYGVIGSNIDVNVAPNFDLVAGFGTTVVAGMGYSFGAKYYFGDYEKTFRPRVSAYYGINSAVQIQNRGYSNNYYYTSKDGETRLTSSQQQWNLPATEEGKSYSGISLGLGGQWMWGQSKSNGLDFDIMLIATTGLNVDELQAYGYDVDEPGRIKISIGYRRAF